jgi:hypothetical protein
MGVSSAHTFSRVVLSGSSFFCIIAQTDPAATNFAASGGLHIFYIRFLLFDIVLNYTRQTFP